MAGARGRTSRPDRVGAIQLASARLRGASALPKNSPDLAAEIVEGQRVAAGKNEKWQPADWMARA